jgi:hypothetical protein
MGKWAGHWRGIGLALVALVTVMRPAAAQEPRAHVADAFAELARLIYDAEPALTHLHLMPFRADRGGPGDCDTELRNAVADAMAKRQADTLSARRVELRQGLGEDAAEAGHGTLRGRYGVVAGEVWAEVTVVAPSGVLSAALPRRILSGLVCKGAAVSLIQAVEARAGIVPDAALSLTLRKEARIGDAVTFDIRSAVPEPTLPLCLNVSGTNTAQLLTPLRPRSPALQPRGTLVWPLDFAGAGLTGGPFCFDREQTDAVICLAMRNAPNPTLSRLWTAAWPQSAREPRDLTMDETLELVSAAAETGAAAAAERYRVGPRAPGATPACAAPRR